MNSVNLIPDHSRSRRFALPTSAPTLALFGGLVLILIAAVLYVSAVNQVTARKSELARVTAGAAGWTAAANAYTPFVQAAEHHTTELADVRQLAAARFPWQQLLSQIGGLMPARAALSSMQATTAPAGTGAAGASAAAAPTPTVQLTGCAGSQSTVAETMVQLHRVHGVTAIALASSADSATSSPSGSSSSATGSGSGCPFSVQFQVTLSFGTASAAATAPSGTGSTASPPTTSTSNSG